MGLTKSHRLNPFSNKGKRARYVMIQTIDCIWQTIHVRKQLDSKRQTEAK
ncbi:hypothetical protein LG276_15100 [Cytobacillus kochii]